MKNTPLRLLFTLLCGFGASPLMAGSYGPQSFSYGNGTTSLGDGTSISSNNGIASVQNSYLRLTANGTGSTSSSFKLPVLDPGAEVVEFTVSFSLRMSTAGTPADGMSVNFGAIPGDNGGGEGGFAMTNGLFIAWDTYNNGGDPQSIEVFSNGSSVGNYQQTFSSVNNVWTPVLIHWDSSGLDITYNGNSIVTNLATPGFVPAPGDRLAFSGRTGGASQDTFIDNLEFNTVTSAPILTGDPVISEFVADNTDLEDEDLESSDWIEIYNGQNSSVNLSNYYLTNDAANKTMWSFPSITMQPFEYRIFFASGKDRPHTATPAHTNFTLPKEGGYLAMIASDGTTVVSEYTYGEQAEDVAYGELGQARTIGFLETPTPERKNDGLQADGPPAEDVVFSQSGGLFTGSVTLSIADPVSPTAVVRYTTNNTIPGESSPVYSGSFNITDTTTIRARVFDTGLLPGETKSRTFIELASDVENFSSAMPIVVADSNSFNLDAYNGASRPFRPVYAVTIDVDETDGFARMDDVPDYNGRGGMHVRGQSSAGFPKRQYAWELWNNEDEDSASSILGMPSESDWILHAPYSDKTLMRNHLVYAKARELNGDGGGMRSRFVELFFNQSGGAVTMADYRGVYLLLEKIKRDNDRVDVEKLNEYVTDPDMIKGGYIFKKDKTPWSQPWYTATENIPLDTHDPQELNTAQFSWLTGHVNAFEAALHSPNFDDPETGYAAYIDTLSFIDNHLFVELFKEIDGYRISQYFSKSRFGKIRALPVWDYNLALGNADYLNGQYPTGWYYPLVNNEQYYWYQRLFLDVEFDLAYWDRFWQLRRTLFSDSELLGAIDSFDAELDAPNASGQSAVTRNFNRWQVLGTDLWPNADGWASRTTHQSEVDWMKNWLTQRMAWVETQSRGTSGLAQPPVFSSYRVHSSNPYNLTMTQPNNWSGASIYYTTDGSDPRVSGTDAGLQMELVSESAACEVLVPSVANGGDLLTLSQWTETTTPPNSADWIAGTQGVGFDSPSANPSFLPEINLDIRNEMLAQNATCYIRIPFTVNSQADIDAMSSLSLHTKCEDAFAAYINGEFVTQDPTRAPATLEWDSRATGSYNDTLALAGVEYDLTPHISKLQPGLNMLAIHGLNFSPSSTDAMWRVSLTATSGAGNTPSSSAEVYNGTLTLTESTTIKARVYDGNKWSPLSSGTYVVNTIPASAANLVVSEFNYRPSSPTLAEENAGYLERGDFEYIELMNIDPSANIDLTGVRFSDGIEFTFDENALAASLVLSPGERLVLVSNPAAFALRHPEVPVAGTFTGSLSNDGEHIEILSAAESVIKGFTYNDVAPWPEAADGDGFSLVLKNPGTNPDHDVAANWRSSTAPGGSPGASDAVTFSGTASDDDDNDGLSAFLEFVLGTSDSDASSRHEPSAGFDAEGRLLFEFQFNLAADNVTLVIESSTDLITWTDAGADFELESLTNHADGTATATYRTIAPVTSPDKLYIRLSAAN